MFNLLLLFYNIGLISSVGFCQIKSSNLIDAAIKLTQQKVVYNAAYFSISYPNGDVPANIGVCADVIIRAYRMVNIDLQKEVHEDMKKHFSEYPQKWKLTKTDSNIDHRRVPNLMTFFKRKGHVKIISKNEKDYTPGDIVCWLLSNNQTHIGIVVDKKSNDGKRWMIVHNIGNGQELSDCLLNYPVIGHYSYGIEH